MASKRKHATALFEVINASRMERQSPPVAKKAPGGWWFARRPQHEPVAQSTAQAAAADPNDPTANVTAASLMQPRQTSTPTAPAEVSHVDFDPAPVEAPAEVMPTGRRPVNVKFDEDRQELTLRVRYTAAVVTAFAVLVVVGLAYVIGRHMAKGPSRADADTTPTNSSDIRKGPSTPGALDVTGKPKSTKGTSRDKTESAAPKQMIPPTGDGSPIVAASGAYTDSPILADGTCRRVSNMNYLLIQRYPIDMEGTAKEVAAFLNANGLPCTVEKGAAKTHTTPGWHCIIGTRGFPPRFGGLKEYSDYLNQIATVTGKYPTKSKLDKVVQPMSFKWAE